MRHHRPSSTLWTRLRGLSRLMALAAACAGTVPARAGEPPADPAAGPVLHLADGGFVPGTFQDSDRPGTLRWQATPFTAPFDFEINAVSAVHLPVPAQPPRPGGDFRFELAGGDVAFGTLVDLDETEALLDLPRFGRLRVRRPHLLRIDRWRDNSDLVYLGPNGLAGWKPSPHADAPAWREESGELVTDQAGASLFNDLGLPARAAIEFEVSWKGRPDFVLALGVGDDEKTTRRAFRFEVWGDDLVVLRETDQEANVASVGVVDSGPGRAHLRAFLDQERERIVVAAPDGTPLADLDVADRKPQVLTGVRLENTRGDVRLERLEVDRWNGEPLRPTPSDRPSLLKTDGSSRPGRVTDYDAEAKEFVLRDGETESRIPRDEVDRVTLSTPADDPPRAVRAVFQDGSRLSGDLVKVEEDALVLAIPGVEGTARLPLDGLRSLVVLHRGTAPPGATKSTARLEIEGVRLTGRLVDGREDPGSGCLTWQPVGSATSSPLRPGVSGRVIYKEPPPPVPQAATRPRPVPPQPAPAGLQGFLRGFAGLQASGRATGPVSPRRSLYLRTGDVIPSEVEAIDENGVTFRTALSQSTFVPHDKVKAVDLAEAPAVTVRLNKSKRERLLTLPRVQKGSPPTHLIRSKNGDYLRGRVVGMDDKTLQVEVRLETKAVPRDRVSGIIWLHPEEADPPKAPAAAAGQDAASRVQAVRSDGVRLTFRPERLEGTTLTGTSDVLGECRVRLEEVDQLLIGAVIEQEAARLVQRRWSLTDAPEPSVVQGDGDTPPTGRAPGTGSALVGKPAPDFELELLGGKTFHLAGSKGRVVVLDFWATWCGPCLQAMPQVERVAGEFRDRGVQLVAVNLQETPKEIAAMLERHKLELTVALDKDGVVAEKYGAHAIPQTVVIDRDGNVARLFVGGGPHLGDQLRDALQAALPDPDTKAPAP
jgi:thiol-disulfide isomerase/thioredoxin